MAKHTPGPWHNEEGYRFLNARSDKGVVADIRIVGGAITPEDKANARLIAAAPDMLEALQAMVAFVATDGHALSMIPEDTWNAARYAIEKTRGEG